MRISFAVLFALALLAGCGLTNYRVSQWSVMGTMATLKARYSDNERYPFVYGKGISNVFAKVENLLNAHNPESELSKLAVLSDSEVLAKCHPTTRACYEAAFRLRDQSGGAFDPRWKGEKILDLGGIAKGYAVDIVDGIDDLWGNCDWYLDLGGNIKVYNGSWRVGIAESDIVLTLTNGQACATSAEYFRGKHIYDARTGNAVTNDLLSVTVVHPNSAMLADGLSTICFILGETEGEAFLKKYYPEARAIWIKKE